MSEKLYYDNSYLKEFSATVVSCEQDKNGFAIVLDKSAFYPEGGGQPYDMGTLSCGETTANVLQVREKAGEVVHYTDISLPQGAVVEGKIDFVRRFDLMQQHTGEHIFSGIVHQLFGLDNVGFHLGEEAVAVDFNGPLTKEDIAQVVQKANEIVWLDQDIIADFPDDVGQIEYRSKKELTGKIRIVRAGEADICACCGTHTSTTAQCGPIVAVDFAPYKGGVRINILSGKRAVDFLSERNGDCYDLSHILSVPVDKIVPGVKARLEEIDNLKLQLSAAKAGLMEYWAKEAVIENDICVFSKEGLTAGEIQSLCSLLGQQAKIALVYSPSETAGGKICLISQEVDTNRLGRHITSALGGKGGGKPGIFQGSVEKSADEVTFKNLIKEFMAQ